MHHLIDHTLLAANATSSQLNACVLEAIEHRFFAVCVNPCNVKKCHTWLRHTEVSLCTVIGFPLGATTSKVKVFETIQMLDNGADEVDMVVNIADVLEEKWDDIQEEIQAVRSVSNGRILKVIFETCLLNDAQIITLCRICKALGVNFVKTSTGFSHNGADTHTVTLMRKTVKDACGVKASGGIRTFQDATKMIEAGATRLGTSAGVAIVTARP